jgi:hypothetical protein
MAMWARYPISRNRAVDRAFPIGPAYPCVSVTLIPPLPDPTRGALSVHHAERASRPARRRRAWT